MFKSFFRKVRETIKDVAPIAAPLAGMMIGNPYLGAGIGGLLGQYGGKEGAMQGAMMGGLGGLGSRFMKGQSLFSPTTQSAINQPITSQVLNFAENSPQAKQQMQGILNNSGNQGSFMDKLKGIGGALYDNEKGEITGLGKGLGAAATSLGPGLLTYLALKGDIPEQPDQNAYRSNVDDYYAARDRGEDVNPADFGLAPTPQERMIGDLNYDSASGSYMNDGGLANLAMGGMTESMTMDEEIIDTPSGGLEEMFSIREQANMNRRPQNQMNLGIPNLAMGGKPMFPRKTGQIKGPGGPKEDKIPAMLSNGEFVMTAKAVQNAGGPSQMYELMNKLDPESSKAPKSPNKGLGY